jgi:ubiquinone/menaquinone biosynthesis C-methylase UbiE
MIGKVFDYTAGYSQPPVEVAKFLNYYFRRQEIKNKVVLDAGCRVGDYDQFLVEMDARKVIGIDLSNRCIETARKRHKANKKIKFYQGDITDLHEFRSNEFDVVFCAGTISYLNPIQARAAIKEFYRVTKPGGVILVLFQKEKGLLIQLVQLIADLIPLNIYLFLIDRVGFLVKPIVEKIVGRKISLSYLNYNVLIGLRGLYFGIPIKIDKKFRVKTVRCEVCSEDTTASYKIKVPWGSKKLSFAAK